jgi:hypothetical protein
VNKFIREARLQCNIHAHNLKASAGVPNGNTPGAAKQIKKSRFHFSKNYWRQSAPTSISIVQIHPGWRNDQVKAVYGHISLVVATLGPGLREQVGRNAGDKDVTTRNLLGRSVRVLAFGLVFVISGIRMPTRERAAGRRNFSAACSGQVITGALRQI